MPSSTSQRVVRTCQSRRRLASRGLAAGNRYPAPVAGFRYTGTVARFRNPAPVAGHRNPAPVT